MTRGKRLDALEAQQRAQQQRSTPGTLKPVHPDALRELAKRQLFALPAELQAEVRNRGDAGLQDLLEGVRLAGKPAEGESRQAYALRVYRAVRGTA